MFEEPILTRKDTPLDELSIDQLKARVADLNAQIEACEAMIAKKQAHLSSADALFGGS